ncbi:DUF4012 domain-containing protein [Candidatus Dojkabacteria bacterium]|nr:DUF4012 domain-containing protein [Candidatus Dojkabacteria bacterium]
MKSLNVKDSSPAEADIDNFKIEDFESKKKKPKKNLKQIFSSISTNIKNLSPKRKRKLAIFGGIIFTLLFLIYYFVSPLFLIRARANSIQHQVALISEDVANKDISKLDKRLNNIEKDLASISGNLRRYRFLKIIPGAKGYFDNLQVLDEFTGKAGDLINKATPELKTVLESLEYKVDDTQDENSEDLKMQALFASLPEIGQIYEDLEPDVLDLIHTLDKIDTEYIPENLPGNLKEKAFLAKDFENDFNQISDELKKSFEVLPDLLGANHPTTYLIVFQNEKELRASGGLLSAFATVTIDKGELVGEIKSVDMWDLQLYLWSIGSMPGYHNEYGQLQLMLEGCGGHELRAQDAGVSPDVHLTLDMFKDYYDIANRYNPGKFPGYDYIVSMNTFFASDMISLVEPVELVNGQVITEDNMAMEIFSRTSIRKGNTDPSRKYAIGEVATVAKQKFTELPSSEFPEFGKTMIETILEKNLVFYSKNPSEMKYFDEMGLAGRVEKDFEGDYFHLNEAQNCALKANVYIYDTVTQTINIAEDGSITKDLNVEWVNEKFYDPAEEEILSGTSNFRYRAWVRVMAPPGTQYISSDGFVKSYNFYTPVSYYDKSIDKEVYDNVIWFDHRRLYETSPVKRHDLNIQYELPETIRYTDDEGYQMFVEKHPGKRDEKYIVTINHNGEALSIEFELDRNKIVSYKDGVLEVNDAPSPLDTYDEWLDVLSKEL